MWERFVEYFVLFLLVCVACLLLLRGKLLGGE